MSDTKKITEEELKNLQELVGKLNNASNQLGGIEMQKHQLLHASQVLQSDMQTMQQKLEETYGKININIQDGTYVDVPEQEEIVSPEVLKK